MDGLWLMSAGEMARKIRDGSIGAEELTRMYLDRIEKYDQPKGLNTVCRINPSAVEAARRLDCGKPSEDQPLYGLGILVKDNIDVAGLHTAAGSCALADNVARSNAPVIDSIIRSGGIILGKTNMTEFANFTSTEMPAGFSSRGGRVRSAYGEDVDPGGSSTGSAVAVSAGFCTMAVGTDTSFSVVACAAQNGITGFKPSHGAVSGKGIIPISETLDSAGALTRTVGDAAVLGAVMENAPVKAIAPIPASKLRIAVNTFDRGTVSCEQLSRYQTLIDALSADGTMFGEISQPYVKHQRTVMFSEFRPGLENYLATSAAKLKTLDGIIDFYEAEPDKRMPYGIPLLRHAAETGTDSGEYREAMSEREKLRAAVISELGGYDACIMTGPTNIMHFCGLPSMALRLCTAADGVPRGIIIYGADEKRLLAAALTMEAYCGNIAPPRL